MNEYNEETPGVSGNSPEGYDQVGGQLVKDNISCSENAVIRVVNRVTKECVPSHLLYVYRHIDSEKLTDKDIFKAKSPQIKGFRSISCLSIAAPSFGGQEFGGQASIGGGSVE